MKIGIDARMFGPKSATGIGNYIKKLSEHLFLLDNKNTYYLFLKEPVYSQFIEPNERVKKIRVDCHWYGFREQFIMPFILFRYKLDLMHFPHFNVPIFYFGRFVVTIHDITPFFFPGPKVRKKMYRSLAYRLVFWFAVKRAKKIITISEHTKSNLVNYFKLPADKIVVAYLGSPNGFIQVKDKIKLDSFKKKYNISKPYIFYVGVWRDHKNLPGLISAYNILRKDFKLDVQLVIGGNQDNRYPENIKAIHGSSFCHDIILPGFIPEDELALFYSAAEVFVLPSFCEGFGLVALEAAACRIPVTASKTTSLPEILGKSAIYFNPNDPADIAKKINLLLKDDDLRSMLIDYGQENIKKYSWHLCAEKTLKIYNSLDF